MAVLYLPLKAYDSTADGRTAIFMSVCLAHLSSTAANIRSFEQITILYEEKFASFAQFRIKINKI
ncbi:MAG: hypothetical protein J6I70_00445 [Bacteroidaceae bacterium]|nr:hypothetical protein [Bacteroidaceae bacterium]